MKKYLTLLLVTHLAIFSKSFSQNIAINGTGNLPDTSAMLDVSSTNKGFLAPRMTTTQQNAIPLPAKGLLIFNTTDNLLRLNTGTTTVPVWTAVGSSSGGSTTNTLGSSSNTLTSTVNGVVATANLVNAVSNSSSNNILSTSVNGVTGSGVSIINSIGNTVSANNLSTTVNGITGSNVQLIGSNALSLSGSNLTSTVNGVASSAVSLSPLLAAATTNTLSSSNNIMTNTTNGISATAPMINTNALALSGSNLTSTVNGVASAAVSLSPLLAAATTNTLSSANNIMTNTTNGVSATAPMINTNALALSGSNLTSTVNGVASSAISLSPLLAAATTNTLSSSNNIITSTTNGVSGTAPMVNSNALSLSGNILTSTVNGVASAGIVLPIPAAFTLNTLTASTQTFATGTSGTNFNISSSGSTHTFNIPDAAAAARGLVSTGTQSFTGNKTFIGATSVSGAFAGSSTVTFNALTSGAAADSIVTIDASGNLKKRNVAAITANNWGITGNSNIGAGNFLGTSDNNSLRLRTNNTERMVIDNNGNTGIGVTDPGTSLVVKDNVEIRRTGSVAQMIFTNTGGSGDFRLGGDGGDIYWQGGGGRSLQMGSYWPTILMGDRQNATFPAFTNGVAGTSIIIASARDASVSLGIQANSASQSANLTEWRNAAGTVLSSVDAAGNIGAGTASPGSKLDVKGTLRLSGSTSGYVGFAPAAAAGSTTYTLPSADGTNGQQLTTNGAGTLSWASAATTSNSTSLSGNNLTTTVNGIASAALDLSPIVTANSWSKTGNAGTTPGTNFIGTTDYQDLVLKVNNTEEMRITAAGNVGISTTTANSTLEVNGSVAVKLVTSSGTGALTLNNAGTVYYVSTAVSSIALPTASTCTNRVYTIVNRSGANRTISSFTNLSGVATTSISNNTSMDVISNGTTWLQIK